MVTADYTDDTLPKMAHWDMLVDRRSPLYSEAGKVPPGVYREVVFAAIPDLMRKVIAGVAMRRGFRDTPDFVALKALDSGGGGAVCGWRERGDAA